jgi:WD40 repeat protein
VIAAGRDAAIKFWFLPTGSLLSSLPGHERTVRALALSPDHAILATAGDDGVIKLWEASPQEVFALLKDHEEWVGMVSFDEEGQILTGAGDDAKIELPEAPGVRTGDPGRLLSEVQRDTGLKVQALQVYPWDPVTGKLAPAPLPEQY